MIHKFHTVLITGASGFVGNYLIQSLQGFGCYPLTMGIHKAKYSLPHIKLNNLVNAEEIHLALKALKNKPEIIYHLAGTYQSEEMEVVNFLYGKALLEASRLLNPQPLVLLVGSAAEYGPQHNNPDSQYGYAISENTICQPESQYGITKHKLTHYALTLKNMQPIIMARPFNVIGKNMPISLALGNFVEQAKKFSFLEKGKEPVIFTKSLNGIRDFIDVRDCVSMLISLPFKADLVGKVINICSGKGTLLRDMVQELVLQLKQSVFIQEECALEKKNDVYIGDTRLLKKLDLFSINYSITETIQNMLKD